MAAAGSSGSAFRAETRVGGSTTPFCRLRASASGGLAAVDVQDFARNECRSLQVQDPFDDVADLADPAEGMKLGHAVIGCRIVHWRLDDSDGHCVHANTP
jgi:hypothetical protein